MTVEKAIRILEPGVQFPDFQHTADDVDEACRIAVDALRAKQTPAKLDRSRWEGCFLCKGATYLDRDVCVSGTHYVGLSEFCFCPNCGRPLDEEAWAELDGRINGGTVD